MRRTGRERDGENRSPLAFARAKWLCRARFARFGSRPPSIIGGRGVIIEEQQEVEL
jgi:hypothetical protein